MVTVIVDPGGGPVVTPALRGVEHPLAAETLTAMRERGPSPQGRRVASSRSSSPPILLPHALPFRSARFQPQHIQTSPLTIL
jgi:hypothetical protein